MVKGFGNFPFYNKQTTKDNQDSAFHTIPHKPALEIPPAISRIINYQTSLVYNILTVCVMKKEMLKC